MHPTPSHVAIDPRIVQEWLAEARACARGEDWARQRGSLRYEWTVQLDVHVFSPRTRRSEVVLATGFDVSEQGLGLHCRRPFPVYTPVIICRAGENTGVCAQVMTCTQSIGGYVIGVRFESGGGPQKTAGA